jgi:hypothetical protein
MQKSDLGRLNVVADTDADGGIIDDDGDDDELRRSKPELDEMEAGDPGPETIRRPVGDKLLGGEHGGDVELGRILQLKHCLSLKVFFSFKTVFNKS